MSEDFRPISHTPPIGMAGKMKFYGRMILDMQVLTIYRDISKTIPAFTGNILDVGCGQSPYKFLLNREHTNYFGIDIVDAEKFGYNNPEITPFNGQDIPFEANKFDGVICTEVLEHVENYQQLVNEIHRVMKKGGTAIATIPWSARYHYYLYDYFRYTPISLKTMFSQFSEVKIQARGTDIVTISSKIIVLFFRNLLPTKFWRWLLVPFWILVSPILILWIIFGHLALILNLGSHDDPVGYTIIVKK